MNQDQHNLFPITFLAPRDSMQSDQLLRKTTDRKFQKSFLKLFSKRHQGSRIFEYELGASRGLGLIT